jgi:CxxC motif-containing protein (DUF1111 family)
MARRNRVENGRRVLGRFGWKRNLEEAILWHGGEAVRAQEMFRRLRSDDRRSLIASLESL